MRILITGVTGMLGKKVYDTLKRENFTVLGIARNNNLEIDKDDLIIGDLTDYGFVKSLSFFAPDAVIHTAANVNVNSCEANKTYTDLIHIESSKYLSTVFNKAIFIYISTDSIFDGITGMFEENSETNPSNYYAITKLKGEEEVLRNNNLPYILRLNIYGYHQPIGNSLFEWGINSLKTNIPIKGFKNVYFNPLYSGQIAEVICQILTRNIPFGIYHLGCNEYLSKYNFLIKIADKFNLNKLLIEGTDAEATAMGVSRPLNTTLVNSKIRKVLPKFDFSFNSGLNLLYQDYCKNIFHEKN